MDNRLREDLLTDLPVGIIENILTCLPIRDAIRTSILSTKWRYEWVSIPQLVFDGDDMSSSTRRGGISEKRLKHFVTSTLFLHRGPIHKFRLCLESGMTHCPVIDQWLLFLSRKDIKELSILFGAEDEFDMPRCLYNFQKLTLLELEECIIRPPPPTFKGFLCLRSLILRFVKAPSGLIESLVANSPLLEHLECMCAGSFELGTSAPNLKYFSVVSTFKKIYLCAPLLAEMDITLNEDDDNGYEEVAEIMHKRSVCSYTEFLGGFTNIESLIGGGDFIKFLSIGMEYCHGPLVFHRLKVISLLQVNFYDVNEVLVVIHLIMGAPNLRELKIMPGRNESADSKAPTVDFWDSECPQNCRFENLKVIKLGYFRYSPHEMKFIKFLLESSPVLDTMIHESPDPTLEEEILDYCRASTNAKILFKRA